MRPLPAGICGGRFCSADPVWYFLLFWFPKYLNDSRHLTLAETGKIAWIVYLAADLGCLSAGYFSGVLIRRGMFAGIQPSSYDGALCCTVTAESVGGVLADRPARRAGGGHRGIWASFWQTSLSTLLVDIYPKRLLGTAFGIVGAGSGLGGMFFTNLVGRVVTNFSYTPLFIAMALMHPLAWLLIRIRPLDGSAE